MTFLLKGALEILPPLLPRILHVADRGGNTRLVCSAISPVNRQLLEAHGVQIFTTGHKTKVFGKHNKFADWSGFKKACTQILKNQVQDSDCLYICSADTALALGDIFTKFPYVFQSNELYDQFPMYKNGIKKYALGAKAFVVPEFNRANICACWYGLKNMPHVIPNIPYVVSRQRNMPISNDGARQTIEGLKDKRIVLYQGHISSDRTLNAIASALREMNDERYVFVLMGTDHSGSVAEITNIYKQTVHIPFVTPPQHLEITSHAYIAVLSYDRVSLNNLFCAPNKIYEYSCYGVPMIGNDIPGLRNTITASGMGICVAYEQQSAVVEALTKLDDNYEQYHENANRFFEESNLAVLMDQLLDAVK